MSAYSDNQDLRIRKTHSALRDALFSLLSQRKFDKITINDICEEAIVSRTAFYSHFEDKYALLKYSLELIKIDVEEYNKEHTDLEYVVNMNEYVRRNEKLLKNLIDENNAELMHILIGVLAKDVSERLFAEGNLSSRDHAVVSFCAGGFANLLMWQLKNNFPIQSDLLGEYVERIFGAIEDFRT